jgi:hypothetical protein
LDFGYFGSGSWQVVKQKNYILKVLVHGKLVATRLSKSMKHIQMPRWLQNSSTFRLYFRYSNSRAEMVMQRVADLTTDHTTDEREYIDWRTVTAFLHTFSYAGIFGPFHSI